MKHVDITPEQADVARAETEAIEADARARFAIEYPDFAAAEAEYAAAWRAAHHLPTLRLPAYAGRRR